MADSTELMQQIVSTLDKIMLKNNFAWREEKDVGQFAADLEFVLHDFYDDNGEDSSYDPNKPDDHTGSASLSLGSQDSYASDSVNPVDMDEDEE